MNNVLVLFEFVFRFVFEMMVVLVVVAVVDDRLLFLGVYYHIVAVFFSWGEVGWWVRMYLYS
ncbi:hypothetical protein AAHH78_32950 [Burkholderia pseudomallei]